MTDFSDYTIGIAKRAAADIAPENTYYLRCVFLACVMISPASSELKNIIVNTSKQLASKNLIKAFSNSADKAAKNPDDIGDSLLHLKHAISKIGFARSEKDFAATPEERDEAIQRDVESAMSHIISYIVLKDRKISDEELFSLIAFVAQEKEAFENKKGPYAGLD